MNSIKFVRGSLLTEMVELLQMYERLKLPKNVATEERPEKDEAVQTHNSIREGLVLRDSFNFS